MEIVGLLGDERGEFGDVVVYFPLDEVVEVRVFK